jgi:hypothetical protein
LERLTRRLLRHPRRRQLAQLLVHQREQFVRSFRVALFDAIEDSRKITHVASETQLASRDNQNGAYALNFIFSTGKVTWATCV